MKVLIFANPNSGTGRGKLACDTVHEILSNRLTEHRFFLTDAAGEEKALLEKLLAEYRPNDRLIIIGGDGTLSLVLQHLPADIPFAFITAGSGNDFARGAGLTRDFKDALDAALNGSPTEIKVLRYDSEENHGVAINNIGIGLDAAIVKATNESTLKNFLNKIKLGQLSYLLSTLRVVFTKKPFRVVIKNEEVRYDFEDAFLFTLTKHPYFGGGIQIAPDADQLDDKIYLTEVDKLSPAGFPALIKKLLAGKHYEDKRVHHANAPFFELCISSDQPMQIDGETHELKADQRLSLRTEKRLLVK